MEKIGEKIIVLVEIFGLLTTGMPQNLFGCDVGWSSIPPSAITLSL